MRFKNIDEVRDAFQCEVSVTCVLYECERTADSLRSQSAVPSLALSRSLSLSFCLQVLPGEGYTRQAEEEMPDQCQRGQSPKF
jgi:hypothetical protein